MKKDIKLIEIGAMERNTVCRHVGESHIMEEKGL